MTRFLTCFMIILGVLGAHRPAGAREQPRTSAGALAPAGSPADTCVEGFDDIPGLFAGNGWLRQVNSSGDPPFGGALAINWDAGFATYGFGSYSGRPGSYVVANYLSAAGGETASTWLVTPEITFRPGASLSFRTRSIWSTGGWPDRLVARLCTGSPCTDMGASADDFGDFRTPLAAVNPDLVAAVDPTGRQGYPIDWTEFTAPLPESGTGRVAFHYYVDDVYDFFSGVGLNGTLAALDAVALSGIDRCPLLHDELFADGFERASDPLAITQNADTDTIVPNITPSCYQGPSAWLRRFALGEQFGLSGPVAVESVDFGIDVSRGNQYVGLTLYAIPHDAEFLRANLTVVGSGQVPIGVDDDGIVKHAAVTGTIVDAAQYDLVVEVLAQPYGGDFFLGANTAPQTGPSYISYPTGICSPDPTDPTLDPAEPTDLAATFPDTHLLMVVHLADTAAHALR